LSYDVQILADSLAPNGVRLTTFQLKYPRMIHAEFMTHRAISRNASSTRAIPTARMIEWVEKDPAMPVYWGRNQKGMQAEEELPETIRQGCTAEWLLARDRAVTTARRLLELGVHKQIASRVLEPWAHINIVATATSWANFFALRCHPAAMPEIQVLAVKMARAYQASKPARLRIGAWHLPYITPEEWADILDLGESIERLARLVKLSVARCARVSYRTFDGKPANPDDDIRLHDQLLENGHWSPFEHQAQAAYQASERSGNFQGWLQYRQRLPKSVHATFDFATLDRLPRGDAG
jgi:thymidylate synthase ThyX